MRINKNKIIIDDYENADYEIINQLLLVQNSIDTLEINNSKVNLDTIINFINNTNIKYIIFNDDEIYYENRELIDIQNLIINNVKCSNFEMFIKFNKIENLVISNLDIEFNCYYLRILKELKYLNMTDMKISHLSSLGYLRKLSILSLHHVPIKSWNFITKIYNLTDVCLSKEYDIKEIGELYNVKIYHEDKE